MRDVARLMSQYFKTKHLLSMGVSLKQFVESTKEVESDIPITGNLTDFTLELHYTNYLTIILFVLRYKQSFFGSQKSNR